MNPVSVTVKNGSIVISNKNILDLDCNRIVNLSPLAALTGLTYLYLSGNQIVEHSLAKKLPHCQIFW